MIPLFVDPIIGVTILSSIALVVFIGIITFFAVAPVFSDTWAERLDHGAQVHPPEGEGIADD